MIKVLIVGSNHFIEQESKKIINKIQDADIETFFGDELNKSEFFSFVNSVSLFGNEKIAFVRNAHSIKELDEFIKSLENCIETNVIIIGNQDNIKNPENIVKGSSFTLLKDKIKKPTKNQVIEIFKQEKMDITSFDASNIFDMCQGDMVLIEKEAEKFALYKHTNPDVTVSELIEFISGEKQEPIYKVVDAFSQRQTANAYRIYETIPKNEENLRLLFYSLSKRIQNLYYAFISDKLINEYQDFVKRNIIDHRRFWTREELSNIISLLSTFDVEMKTGLKQIENAVNEIITLSGIKNYKK